MHIRRRCGGTIFAIRATFSRLAHGHWRMVLPAITLAALLGVSWWRRGIPAPNRVAADTSSRHLRHPEREGGRAAALFFNIAHYAIRSWTGVKTAHLLARFCTAERSTRRSGINYVKMMVDLLPAACEG